MEKIETNPQLERAERLFKDGRSLFITGKAGTGKTTLLRKLVEGRWDRVLIAAPTGLAAVTAGGSTIHSLFRIKPRVIDPSDLDGLSYSAKLVLTCAQVVVVDEVSMVRPDLLHLIDDRLRSVGDSKKPFGGKQMVFIGDLYQLPPVVDSEVLKEYLEQEYGNEYFFSHPMVKQLNAALVELTKVYRQKDEKFLGILNDIRDGDLSSLPELNQRVEQPQEGSIVLTATNYAADRLNDDGLANKCEGDYKTYEATIEGEFKESQYPAPQFLMLRVGARVMATRNKYTIDGKVVHNNGSMGYVRELQDDSIAVEFDNGSTVHVTREEWTYGRYNAERKGSKFGLRLEMVGSFHQFPLKLAWAVTIHKSQGQTYDKVHVDMGGGAFAPGQTYVALSRCRSLEGLTLERNIGTRDVFVDPRIHGYREVFDAA